LRQFFLGQFYLGQFFLGQFLLGTVLPGTVFLTAKSYKEKQTLVAAPCHGMETNSQYHWEVIPDGDLIKLRHRYYRQCIQFHEERALLSSCRTSQGKSGRPRSIGTSSEYQLLSFAPGH